MQALIATGFASAPRAYPGWMAPTTPSEAARLMGARLRAVRVALGATQATFAAEMGVGATTVANWEAGRNLIDIYALARAADRFRFSTDFIVLGDLGGMPFDLAMRVQDVQRRELGATPQRGRPPARRDTPLVRAVPDAHEDVNPKPRVLHEKGPAPLTGAPSRHR